MDHSAVAALLSFALTPNWDPQALSFSRRYFREDVRPAKHGPLHIGRSALLVYTVCHFNRLG